MQRLSEFKNRRTHCLHEKRNSEYGVLIPASGWYEYTKLELGHRRAGDYCPLHMETVCASLFLLFGVTSASGCRPQRQ